MPIRHLILDEVQFAKDYTGATHMAIKDLYYECVTMLSETLMSNRWTNIFDAVDFLPNHLIATLEDFLRGFSTRYNDKWGTPNLVKQDHLVKFLMAFTIARPSALLSLPGLILHTTGFALDDLESQMVVLHTKMFYDKMRGVDQDPDRPDLL